MSNTVSNTSSTKTENGTASDVKKENTADGEQVGTIKGVIWKFLFFQIFFYIFSSQVTFLGSMKNFATFFSIKIRKNFFLHLIE